MSDLRKVRQYIGSEPEDEAMLDLIQHVKEFNGKFGRGLVLTLPKRPRRREKVVGKASDQNHLLYQDFVDAILAGCPKPLTVEAIRQKLVQIGEKPTTAKMISPDYFKLITKVLNPNTKRHRGSQVSLAEWMSE